MLTIDHQEPEPPSRGRVCHRIRKRFLDTFARIYHWIKRRPFIALSVGIVTSSLLGWAFGSWSTCGSRCEFDTELFGAWGAWVGGLATTGAFIFTAHELVSSRRREEKTDDLRAQEVLTRARHVEFYWDWDLHEARNPRKEKIPLICRVVNDTDSPITNLRAVIEETGTKIAHREQLDPPEPERMRHIWEFEVPDTAIPSPFTAEEARQNMWPLPFIDPIRVEFTLEGHQFKIILSQVTLTAHPYA